jgi:hypothetical protein
MLESATRDSRTLHRGQLVYHRQRGYGKVVGHGSTFAEVVFTDRSRLQVFRYLPIHLAGRLQPMWMPGSPYAGNLAPIPLT